MKVRIILPLLLSLYSGLKVCAMQLSHEDKQASIQYREQLVKEAKDLGIPSNRNNADLKAAIREERKKRTSVNKPLSTPPVKEHVFDTSASRNIGDAELRKNYRAKLVREAQELGIPTDKNNSDLKAAIRAERDRLTTMSNLFHSLRTEEELLLEKTKPNLSYREKLVRDAEYLGISTDQSNKDLKAAIKDAKRQVAIEREYEILKHCAPSPKSPIKLFFGELPKISDHEKRESLEGQAKFLGVPAYGTNEELQGAINAARKKKNKAELDEEAVSLGLAVYGTSKELQKRIQDRKAALPREKLEMEAYELGISTAGSSEELQKAIQKKKDFTQEQEAKARAYYSNVGSPAHTSSREYQKAHQKAQDEMNAMQIRLGKKPAGSTADVQRAYDIHNAHQMNIGGREFIGSQEDIARRWQVPEVYDPESRKWVRKVFP